MWQSTPSRRIQACSQNSPTENPQVTATATLALALALALCNKRTLGSRNKCIRITVPVSERVGVRIASITALRHVTRHQVTSRNILQRAPVQGIGYDIMELTLCA
eukprot:Opistho-2@80076